MREGWWNKAGYETYWDLVQTEDAGCKAARIYGLSPSTLARLLIHRGAFTVFEARGEETDGAA